MEGKIGLWRVCGNNSLHPKDSSNKVNNSASAWM